MNAKTFLALSLLLSAPAAAADRVLMDIDCDQPVRPTLQRFAADAGLANAHAAHAARHEAWVEAMRACHRGYDRVRVISRADAGEPARALALGRR